MIKPGDIDVSWNAVGGRVIDDKMNIVLLVIGIVMHAGVISFAIPSIHDAVDQWGLPDWLRTGSMCLLIPCLIFLPVLFMELGAARSRGSGPAGARGIGNENRK